MSGADGDGVEDHLSNSTGENANTQNLNDANESSSAGHGKVAEEEYRSNGVASPESDTDRSSSPDMNKEMILSDPPTQPSSPTGHKTSQPVRYRFQAVRSRSLQSFDSINNSTSNTPSNPMHSLGGSMPDVSKLGTLSRRSKVHKSFTLPSSHPISPLAMDADGECGVFSPSPRCPGLPPSFSPTSNRKVRLSQRRNISPASPVSISVEPATPPTRKKLSQTRRNSERAAFIRRSPSSLSRSSSPLRLGTFFSRIQTFSVKFVLPTKNSDIIQLQVSGNHKVGQIKEQLWAKIIESNILEANPELAVSASYTMKYNKIGMLYELYDQEQLFQTLSIVEYWHKKGTTNLQLMVQERQTITTKERKFNTTIGILLGLDLREFISQSNSDEADITQCKLAAVRHTAISSRDEELYAMEPSVTNIPMPEQLSRLCRHGWLSLTIQYKCNAEQSQTIEVQTSEKPSDLLQYLFSETYQKRDALGIPPDAVASDFVLKVCGLNDYFYGPHQFSDFTYVRRCLLRKKTIRLAVVAKPDVKEDDLPDIPGSSLIDEGTSLTGSHQQLSALTKSHSQVYTMSLWDLDEDFRVTVCGIDNLAAQQTIHSVYVEVGIYHGGELLCPAKSTSELPAKEQVRWNQELVFDIATKNLPKAARLHIIVHGITKKASLRRNSSTSPRSGRVRMVKRRPTLPQILTGRRSSITELSLDIEQDEEDSNQSLVHDSLNDSSLCWVNMQLLNHRAFLRMGRVQLSLWSVPVIGGESDTSTVSPNSCTSENPDYQTAAVLHIQLDEFAHGVAFPTSDIGTNESIDDSSSDGDSRSVPDQKVLRECLNKAISASDPLQPLTKDDKYLLWSCRKFCVKRPEALPRFLQSVNFADKNDVLEMHRLLAKWAKLTPEVALQLLDYHFADEKVRRLAVQHLDDQLDDDYLIVFLLQLVQTLKFEPYHDSALAHFLLRRALKSKRIGHNFFWFLRAEVDTPEFRERFGLLLDAYLRGCGQAMLEKITKQQRINRSLASLSAKVKTMKLEERASYLQNELSKDLNDCCFSPVFNSSLVLGRLAVDQCKCMDSKKVPLWLEFSNVDETAIDEEPVKVIFKQGDDLRQDMLTLQMLRLMDKLWQDHGLDLCLIPYGCVSTGFEEGMIEVVLKAHTVASIQRKQSTNLVTTMMAVFNDEILNKWLKKKQPTHADYVQAVKTFTLSCAGYCVATYVLGIGDRHNDNIMITQGGNLFHIDFGHFLGNTKKFLHGLVNRERAPFVLTPDFVHIMGKKDGANFQNFLSTACKAYNIIRRNANLFINLFSMMKCTGIPELTSTKDIDYLRNVLVLHKTEQEAEDYFISQVDKCLHLAWSVQMNWWAHNARHREK